MSDIMFQKIKDYINNNVGFAHAEVVKYNPDFQSISVKILPDKLITTDIPIGTPYGGRGVGFIRPFYEGQQVVIGFIGNINNSFLVSHTYNLAELPPTRPASRSKYGVLKGRIIDPSTDTLIGNLNNTFLISESKGVVINSNEHINLVSSKPSSMMSPFINFQGNTVTINAPTDDNEENQQKSGITGAAASVTNTNNTSVIPIYNEQGQEEAGPPSSLKSKSFDLDDLNNKVAQLMCMNQSIMIQLEKFGSLVQLLTFAVWLIGKTPLKVIDVYDLYPQLANSPFIKEFRKKVTDIKAMMMFFDEAANLVADTVGESGGQEIADEIRNMNSEISRATTYSQYLNYLNYDPVDVIKSQASKQIYKYDNLIVQKIPQLETVKSEAMKQVNKANRVLSLVQRWVQLIQKAHKRITEHGIFRRDKEKQASNESRLTNIQGTQDFGKTPTIGRNIPQDLNQAIQQQNKQNNVGSHPFGQSEDDSVKQSPTKEQLKEVDSLLDEYEQKFQQEGQLINSLQGGIVNPKDGIPDIDFKLLQETLGVDISDLPLDVLYQYNISTSNLGLNDWEKYQNNLQKQGYFVNPPSDRSSNIFKVGKISENAEIIMNQSKEYKKYDSNGCARFVSDSLIMSGMSEVATQNVREMKSNLEKIQGTQIITNPSEIRRGDIVMYLGSTSGGDHIGIALGNGSKGKVVHNSTDSGYVPDNNKTVNDFFSKGEGYTSIGIRIPENIKDVYDDAKKNFTTTIEDLWLKPDTEYEGY